MNKQKAKETIKKIAKMDKAKLILFTQELFLCKSDISPKVFDVLVRATDLQMMNLQEVTDISPIVVLSDLREGEVWNTINIKMLKLN